MRSCSSVWALSGTYWLGLACLYPRAFCGWLTVPSRSVLSAAIRLGAWRIPPFGLQPRVIENSAISLSFLWLAFPVLGHLPGCGFPGC